MTALRVVTLLVSLLGAGSLAIAPDAAAQAATRRVLRINWFIPDAPTVTARESGALQQVGLDASYTITTGSTPQMHGLSNGTYDLAYTAFDNVLAWSGREGAEIVAVAQTDNAVDVPLYIRPEITSWGDLRGKTLAVDAVDTAYALVLRRILLAHDLDLNRQDYQIVGVGGPQQRLDAMTSGQAVGAIMGGPYSAAAEGLGMVRFAEHTDVLPDLPGLVIAVNRAWSEAHRDDLTAFLRAWVNGGRVVQADRTTASNLLTTLFNVTLEQTAGLLPLDWRDGELNKPGLQSVVDLRTQFGYTLPMGTDPSTYLDTSFYEAATDTSR